MIKPTPNPPETLDRTHDHYLNPPKQPVPHKPGTMFVIAPDINTETLLAHACESLASASVMASDFAGFLQGSQRNTLLGIAQVIMLGELAVNRALDILDPQD
ncbi:DUF6124 family protein [Pseudomonas sp. A-R-19]|uniref:DUF6124 family protein n=1 Tax=Pseudomonas sp. A-R-19 TaxID=2832403 RepID=UPI001CBC121B|nr:DUF6124 family protein [Pseudomonas sp. A-R-19]